MKQLIQSLLRPLGYRLQDLRKIGREPWRDMQLLLQDTPDPVCFDVGAHRGETINSIIANFPRASIYAFEPDPENFAALQCAARHIAAAKLFPLGMGDSPCVAKLQKTHFSMSNSILPAAASLKSEAHKKIGEVEITVSTIDQFCEEQKLEMIDLLKTDCQGFDLRVLKGAKKMLAERRIQVIQCESLFVSEYEGQGWFYEIQQFLNEAGYVPVSFGEPARNQHHEILWMDVLFKRRT